MIMASAMIVILFGLASVTYDRTTVHRAIKHRHYFLRKILPINFKLNSAVSSEKYTFHFEMYVFDRTGYADYIDGHLDQGEGLSYG